MNAPKYCKPGDLPSRKTEFLRTDENEDRIKTAFFPNAETRRSDFLFGQMLLKCDKSLINYSL